MSAPVFADIVTYFYPIGNTPAIHLTRNLPPKQPADILLLGCGDVRNILFTIYADHDSNWKLDLTCCDIEPAIIVYLAARNILLLTLILETTDSSNEAYLWDIYYHPYLVSEPLKLLSDQATKLHALATSIHSWNNGKYSRQFRFCDQDTLVQVKEIWDTYRITHLNGSERERHLQRSKAAITRAMDRRKYEVGDTVYITTGLRSAAPAAIYALEEVPNLNKHYWKYGSIDGASEVASQKPQDINPMFVTDMSTLHYNIDPLHGFHIATAYVPLAHKSPLRSKSTIPRFKAVEAAKLQFRTWSSSFRRYSDRNLVMRFFVGDAVAFSHALHQRQIYGNVNSAEIYRDPYRLKPLVLDGGDYMESSGAPLSFNVIDTSNLIDHVGAMNLLVATTPLLSNTSSASLFTESMVKREKNYKAYIDNLLCGHFLPSQLFWVSSQ